MYSYSRHENVPPEKLEVCNLRGQWNRLVLREFQGMQLEV